MELSKGRRDEEIWRMIKTTIKWASEGYGIEFIEIAFCSSSALAKKNRFPRGLLFAFETHPRARADQHYLHVANMENTDWG